MHQGKTFFHVLFILTQSDLSNLFVNFLVQINAREEPYYFDRGIVSQQIRVLQIFETLQLLQSGR